MPVSCVSEKLRFHFNTTIERQRIEEGDGFTEFC